MLPGLKHSGYNGGKHRLEYSVLFIQSIHRRVLDFTRSRPWKRSWVQVVWRQQSCIKLLMTSFDIQVVGKLRQAAIEGWCLEPLIEMDPDTCRGCCQSHPMIRETAQIFFWGTFGSGSGANPDLSSRSSYSRISRGPPPNNQMGGRERRGSCTNNDTETVLKLYQEPNVLRKVQGLNAQAKGEVQILISGRGRAIQAKGEVLMGGGQ